MKSIAIIGYGALGKILTGAVLDHLKQEYIIEGIFDSAFSEEFISLNNKKIPFFKSEDDLLNSKADLVVEIAGVDAVKQYSEKVLRAKKDLIITSVGALADEMLYYKLKEIAKSERRKIHIVSGAIGGLDIISTLSLMSPCSVSIESVKSPQSLEGAPHLNGQALSMNTREQVFSGNAIEAICGFPKNTNVSVTAGLSSNSIKELKVSIISDPTTQNNSHTINIENERAKALIEVVSKPDKENPKSSITAAWSVAALLKNLTSPIQFF